MLLRLLRSYKLSANKAISDWQTILRLQSKLASHTYAVLMVEPVTYQQTMMFTKHLTSFTYVCGVASSRPSGPTTLHLSSDNLGHSIIPSKPNLTGHSHSTWNFNMLSTLEWYARSMCVSPQDTVILRINAEGVEKEIIEDLKANKDLYPKITALFGSLGDVKKCFGTEAERSAQAALRELGIPYFYFTSSPRSWRPALEALHGLLS